MPAPNHTGQVALFQELTDSEQACVSRKISKLRGEGVEEDEAVVRAIKECAPSKAQPTNRSGHKEVDQEADIPRYRADRAVDGTFTIFDVPIFASHKEERSDGREIDFGTAWLHGALDTAQRRQAEGYMAPLHVSHHGEGNVEAAGKFRMTRVGKITHDGEEVDALFADLVGVRPEVFDRISRGELSYRSVEILDVNRAEIDSLALLDDEVPFFRFPLLRVAVDRLAHSPAGGDARITLARSASSGPARYYTASGAGKGTATLFCFKEQAMPDPKTGTAEASDPTTKNAGAEQLLMQIFSMLQQALGQQAPELPNGMAGPPQATAGQHPQGPGPIEQRPPQMLPRATPVGMAMGFEAKEADITTEEPKTDLAAKGAQDGMAARLAQLEIKFSAAEQQASIERQATNLATRGFSSEQVEKFRGVAAEHGLDGALVYAKALEDHGPSTPPSNWSGEIHGEAPDAPEVSKYAAQGPEALAAARDYYRSWKSTGSDVSFEEYFQSNHNADAFLGLAQRS